jgi:hypothetical protein
VTDNPSKLGNYVTADTPRLESEIPAGWQRRIADVADLVAGAVVGSGDERRLRGRRGQAPPGAGDGSRATGTSVGAHRRVTSGR